MMANKNKQPELLKIDQPQQFKVLENELLQQVIKNHMPELLDESIKSFKLLRIIDRFLFCEGNEGKKNLKELLDEDLFIHLCGLKKVLESYNINVFTLALDQHKKQFGTWIQENIYSEEEE